MLHFEDKLGHELTAPQIAQFLISVKGYRSVGLRKQFAIACACQQVLPASIAQYMGAAIWKYRDRWLKR
jgi:hypothetical protein